MAKDVDLSSKEWTDLVFEGKNKEYGAYVLRRQSNKRHNKAMLAVVVILAALALLAFLVNTVIKSAEARPEDLTEQEVIANMPDEAEEQEDEPEPERIEEQQPEEVLKEELLNSAKMTEVLIAADNEVESDIKSQDELKEDDRAISTVDEDRGVDDIIKAAEHENAVVVEEKKPEVVEHKVFESVEQMPEFPGGDKALLQWLADHLKYPTVAQENGIQGRVTVRFVVNRDGTVGEAKIVRSKDPDLDKEALRVVKMLPRFIPGKMNGQAVSVWYTVPVTFRLQGS